MIPNLLIIIVIFCVAIYLVYRIYRWKPTMLTDSKGDPDSGEACGYCCISLISIFTILLIASILIFAYLEV